MNLIDKNYWKGKGVLVTGAEGFMGSHLTERLLELGSKVSILVRGTSRCGTSQYELKNLNHVKNDLGNIIACDISSPDVINLIIKEKPQILFHLAAIAYVPYSFLCPREVHNVNVIGTINVLESGRSLNHLERIVITSSSEVYGPALSDFIDENHPLNPTSPYAASKVAADRYAYSYFKTYGLPVAIIRPFNYYGPRHIYDVIPKFIRMVLRGEAPTIYGSGKQSRDLTYIDDIVDAFLIMGSNDRAIGEVVNFGSGIDVSVEDIAFKIIKYSGSDLKPIYIEKRLAEVSRLCCDYRKAKRLFGWTPKINIDEGLKRNIAWCKTNWTLELV